MGAIIAVDEFTASTARQVERIVSALRKSMAPPPDVSSRVTRIVDKIRREGDRGLLELIKKFDSPNLRMKSQVRVADSERRAAYSKLTTEQVSSIRTAADQLSSIAAQQMKRFLPRRYASPLGFVIEESYVPFERIGGYVPGGLASYPSTALMICVTARLAGVKEVVLATPPRSDGTVDEGVLVAADICGVKEIFKAGGAQAVAALALGTKSIRKVDLIAGPGNQYVTEAKRQVASTGEVLIDNLAGPTELLILADESADAKFVAEDLISQAEHGNKTLCGLVSDSRRLIGEVRSLLERSTERPRISKIAESRLFTLKVPSEKAMLSFAQSLAPEHVELMVRRSRISRSITNSGIVMLGNNVPCSSTDYIAGTNHILPTGGTARFSSGLNVSDFLKRVSVVSASKSTLRTAARFVSVLAEMEGLPNHGRAVISRFER